MNRWSALLRRKHLRIVLRQSPDWRSTPHAQLIEGSRAFCRAVGAAAGIGENFIADVVAVWDSTFALPYFAVRAALKDIAAANLATVRNATLATAPQASVSTPTRAAPMTSAPALHLFIDDDDWLHPHLWREIKPFLDAPADGYIFGNVLCLSRVELRLIEACCYTNNYAVAERYLRAHQGDVGAVLQHWDAHAAFHQPAFRCAVVPRYLSATNKHPASTMKLKDGLANAELSATTLRTLVEKYMDESAQPMIPEHAAWVAPYMRQVREVFARLL